MFDHYRIKLDKDMHTYNYGNNSYYYKEDAIHYDRRNYFYQEYTSYSSVNSYDYDCRPTFNTNLEMSINHFPYAYFDSKL